MPFYLCPKKVKHEKISKVSLTLQKDKLRQGGGETKKHGGL
jgi:hypothetical protein